MSNNNKNEVIIKKMIMYCDKILDIYKNENLTKEKYMSSDIIQLAIICAYFN